MKLALIAAIAKNRVIGKGGTIPWHIPEDLKRFKRLTTGHAVLMGRRTWESIGKPLPNRRNVVISSHDVPGLERYATPGAAIAALHDQERVFIIGGASVYAMFLDRADELYLTYVDREVPGDTLFPPFHDIVTRKFRVAREELHEGYRFVDYVRLLTPEN